MGGCMSSEKVDADQVKAHKEVEKELRDTKAKMDTQVKILLLGPGDSGKSTILKQMRLIHKVPFTPQELEFYRQLVFNNITQGFRTVFQALEYMELELDGSNLENFELIENSPDIRDGDNFPIAFLEPLQKLWKDPAIEKAIERGNEAALPDNLNYFFADLPRLFSSDYRPTEQDIIRSRARTTGITETVFRLKTHDLHMLDVGGQKSERRKWIHCFQDVTTILFLVALSGYDECLVEDKDANQMQDAMTIWDSICHSQWFKQTSIILFLNKDDLFEQKVKHSDIKLTFPDYEGETGSSADGREYFKKRFMRLSIKANRIKEREIYVHFTNATDTALLRVVMSAVEDITLRDNLSRAALI